MISGPRNSRPTLRGWVNKTTGQLVKAETITKAQIDEWDAAQSKIKENDPLNLNSDPLGLGEPKSSNIDLDIPDDLGLEELDFDDEYKGVMEDFVQKRRNLGNTYLEKMRKSGELDMYKDIIAKTMRKK